MSGRGTVASTKLIYTTIVDVQSANQHKKPSYKIIDTKLGLSKELIKSIHFKKI